MISVLWSRGCKLAAGKLGENWLDLVVVVMLPALLLEKSLEF